MTILPGAEPFRHAGSASVGVLLCHGFTGTPQSMRAWADYLVDAGLSVSLPLLPGHGTDWHDLRGVTWQSWYAEAERALLELREQCEQVVVMGLSMGGALALRLAQRHGAAIAGLVLVNPSVRSDDRRLVLVPLLRHLVASVPGIGGDIAKPGVTELAYSRTPLDAVHALRKLWRVVAADLAAVTQPVLLFRSAHDHVVSDANAATVVAGISSSDVTRRSCPNSGHVATLDYDAEEIFRGSLEFTRRVTGTPVARTADEAPAGTDSTAATTPSSHRNDEG